MKSEARAEAQWLPLQNQSLKGLFARPNDEARRANKPTVRVKINRFISVLLNELLDTPERLKFQ